MRTAPGTPYGTHPRLLCAVHGSEIRLDVETRFLNSASLFSVSHVDQRRHERRKCTPVQTKRFRVSVQTMCDHSQARSAPPMQIFSSRHVHVAHQRPHPSAEHACSKWPTVHACCAPRANGLRLPSAAHPRRPTVRSQVPLKTTAAAVRDPVIVVKAPPSAMTYECACRCIPASARRLRQTSHACVGCAL